MKYKCLLLGGVLVITGISFACGGYGYGNYRKNLNSQDNIKLFIERGKEFNEYQLQIERKRAEIAKFRNSDNIDWNQVAKLNREISEIEAKIEAELMKYQKIINVKSIKKQ